MAARPTEWIHVAFESPAIARDALDRLARQGVSAEDVEVRSSIPLDDEYLSFGARPSSHVFRNAVIGGLLGATAFFFMVKLTSEAYPLLTGGLPTVGLPPAGIITFEGVAIGAILTTVATVFYECRLPSRWHDGPLDHYLADDCVLVIVRWPEDASMAWAAQAIETARSGSK